MKIAPPGKLISVGSHKLHVISEGGCGPTVVFDHGAGGSALTWNLVYPEIAKIARVLVYDRAGYGWSESGPQPRTNEKCVEDLYKLVKNIDGPVILVGHSFGGINVRLFAERHPEKTAGLVLVDATHEDELTDRFPKEHQKGQQMVVKMMGMLETMSKLGIVRLMAAWKMVPGFSKTVSACPDEVQKLLWKTSFQSKAIAAAHSEFSHLYLGYELVRQAKPLGDIPVTVIAAGIVDQFIPGTSEEVQKQIKQTLMEVAADMSRLSNNGKLIVADKSSHDVHLMQPEVVIQAIEDMVRGLEK